MDQSVIAVYFLNVMIFYGMWLVLDHEWVAKSGGKSEWSRIGQSESTGYTYGVARADSYRFPGKRIRVVLTIEWNGRESEHFHEFTNPNTLTSKPIRTRLTFSFIFSFYYRTSCLYQGLVRYPSHHLLSSRLVPFRPVPSSLSWYETSIPSPGQCRQILNHILRGSIFSIK
jgi:hypothetical protein